MKMKCYLLLLIGLLVLCSCESGEVYMNEFLSPNDKNIMQLSSNIYNDECMFDIVNFEGDATKLNIQYSLECVRMCGEFYRVTYIGYNKYATIVFDDDGNKVFARTYDADLLKSDFDNIKVGELISNVLELDPTGDYPFMHTGRNDIMVSTHYTKDGYMITISYENNNVKKIDTEFI